MKNKNSSINMFILLLTIACAINFGLGCSDFSKKVNPEKLYSVYSKDVGWNYLDSTITEVERGDRTSLLKLINFNLNTGTGMDGRFFFCYVIGLAHLRGFRYLIWSPEPVNNTILVVFLKSEDESIESIIGNQFSEYSFDCEVQDVKSELWKNSQDICGF